MELLIAFGLLGAAKMIYDAIGEIDEAEQRIIARYQLGSRLEGLMEAKEERLSSMNRIADATRDKMDQTQHRSPYGF